MESLITGTNFDTRKIKNLIRYIKGHPELKLKLDKRDFKWCYNYLRNSNPNLIDFVSSLTLLLLQIKELPLTDMTEIPEFFISYYDNPKLTLNSENLGIKNYINVNWNAFDGISLDTLSLSVHNLSPYSFRDCVINTLFLNGKTEIVLQHNSIENCTIHTLAIRTDILNVHQLSLKNTAVDTLYIYADNLEMYQPSSTVIATKKEFSSCYIDSVILEGDLAAKVKEYRKQAECKRFFNCNKLELRA